MLAERLTIAATIPALLVACACVLSADSPAKAESAPASCQGEVGLAVRVIADHGDRVQIGITVRDTGIGIPEHLHDRLFTPFAQADPSVSRLYGGSGLGLSISRRLVELMGGTIALSSRPGTGATFELDLTLTKVPDHRAVAVRSAAGIAGTRLLIVDPNATTGMLMEQHAGNWGVETERAASGAEAWSELEDARQKGRAYDVVLIDRALPDMGGEELGRRIKADPELAATQLVMVTSSGLRGDAARVSQIGFAAYLPKPVTAAMLLDCLRELRAQGRADDRAGGALITVHSISERKPAPLRILLGCDGPIPGARFRGANPRGRGRQIARPALRRRHVGRTGRSR